MVRSVIFAILLFTGTFGFTINTFHPYLKNYELPQAYRNQKVISIAGLPDETVVFALEKGLLQYDGIKWGFLTIPEQPTFLYTDDYSGTLFVGCEKAFGVVKKTKNGELEFNKLTDSLVQKNAILRIVSVNENVYTHQSSAITCFNTKLNKITKTWKSGAKPYEGIFVFGDKVYVSVSNKGIFELQDKGAKLIYSGNIGSLLIFQKSADLLTLQDTNGQFYSFNGTQLKPYSFSSQNYIIANQAIETISIDDNFFAVGTKNAGVIILDKASGDIIHTINYQTQLPDDEIRCLYLDANSGLWIGHASGISRADLVLPIADFSFYPGLKGRVQTSLIHKNILYVGTSQGVYYLTDVSDYKEIEAFTRIEHTKESVESVVKMKKVKKIVRVSFQNKSGKGSITKDIPVEIEVPTDSIIGIKKEKFTSNLIREQYILKSFPLQFKKIEGITAKCLHLCPAGDNILVGSNDGLYQIVNKKASVLLAKAVVRYIEPSINDNYFALSSAGLLSFAYKERFEIISMNESLTDASSLDFSDNTLWITSGSELKKIRVAKGRYFGIEESYPLDDYFPEDNVVASINKSPTIFSYSESYIFNKRDSKLEAIAPLKKYVSIIQRPLVNQQNYFWAKGPDCWANLKDSANTDNKGYLLNLFEHIEDIQVDVKGNLWVVSNNRLYKIYGDRPKYQKDPTFAVSINAMSSQSPLSFDGSTVDIENKNLGLEIAYSAKYYLNESDTKYRYRLLGLNDIWSDWDEISTIRYPYIPGGNYVFELEAKNIIGQISAAKPITIKVHEPFWEQWWFYLSFGSVLIGGLVFVFAGKTVAAGVQQDL